MGTQPHRPRWLVAVLCGVIGLCVLGTIAAAVPSMARQTEDGILLYTYAISVLVAPVLFVAIAITALRALRPTRRRLAIATLTLFISLPVLFLVEFARRPFFDIDNEFLLLAPGAIETYLAGCKMLLIAAAVLGVYTCRREPDPPSQLPTAVAR